MTDHNRRRGTSDARHVVMLRHPDAAIAPSLGMNRNIAGVVERAACIGFFGDADEIENRQCRHENLLNENGASEGFAGLLFRALKLDRKRRYHPMRNPYGHGTWVNQSVERGGEADHHHNRSSAVALISGEHYPFGVNAG
jgi:hypothetical protein